MHFILTTGWTQGHVYIPGGQNGLIFTQKTAVDEFKLYKSKLSHSFYMHMHVHVSFDVNFYSLMVLILE